MLSCLSLWIDVVLEDLILIKFEQLEDLNVI